MGPSTKGVAGGARKTPGFRGVARGAPLSGGRCAAAGRGFAVQEWRRRRGRFPTKGTFPELTDPLTHDRRGTRPAVTLWARGEPRDTLHGRLLQK